ncbi:MAG TPA: universal stress protein, partial [Beijerinckiaceae bacterium]
KRIDGADLAPHLARHCRNVRVVNLPERGDVGETLREHARLTRADLLVMGAYAHTRLRQMVLGGVTSRMIVDPVVPTLMSY